MSEEQLKSYYAIIPANVRYDAKLKDKAKLLYGEITALCNEKGYCWATNDYFANLYGVSKTTISLLIKNLIEGGYLESQIVYKEGTKEILNRYLSIVKDPIKENLNTPIKEKLKDNNTSINNTFNNTYYINEELNELFIDFLKMRKQLKAVNSERAINSLINTLSKYDDDTKYKMIENSITNSWKGVFPLKQEKTYQAKPVRQEIVPDWLNKEVKENTATAEEIAELEEYMQRGKTFEERRARLQARLQEKYRKN